MGETCYLIGNGKSSAYYDPKSVGTTMTCNLPPFPVPNAFATAIVDFKMMRAIQEESIVVPGDWILGMRPKMHLEHYPNMYMKYAPQIREFYTVLPKYVPNYTDFSCGHMAAHYMCTKFRPDEIHMYGFDSIFNFDLYSCSDFYLPSDRDHNNSARLSNNWRGIWPSQFEEFRSTKFILHGNHTHLKLDRIPKNVEIVVH